MLIGLIPRLIELHVGDAILRLLLPPPGLLCFFAQPLPVAAPPAMAQVQIQDSALREMVVAESRAEYHRTGRPCACPMTRPLMGGRCIASALSVAASLAEPVVATVPGGERDGRRQKIIPSARDLPVDVSAASARGTFESRHPG